MKNIIIVYSPDETTLEQALQALVRTALLESKTISTQNNGGEVLFLTEPKIPSDTNAQLIILPTTDLEEAPATKDSIIITFKPPTLQIKYKDTQHTTTIKNKKEIITALNKALTTILEGS